MPSQIINFWFVTCCFIVCNSFSFTCKWFCNSHVLCCISIQLLCPFFHIYYFQLLLSKVFRFINISNQNVPTASITSMIALDIPGPSCKQVFMIDTYSSSTRFSDRFLNYSASFTWLSSTLARSLIPATKMLFAKNNLFSYNKRLRIIIMIAFKREENASIMVQWRLAGYPLHSHQHAYIMQAIPWNLHSTESAFNQPLWEFNSTPRKSLYAHNRLPDLGVSSVDHVDGIELVASCKF